jgi:3-oxoacyl-[acyl-carrier protein] reductase
MTQSRLAGKRVLITAGAQGIGEAITRHFIEAGAHPAIHYFSGKEKAEELAGLAGKAGLKSVALQGDLTDAAQAEAVVAGAAESLGGLDILINNAGSLVGRKRLEELDVAFWDHVMGLNVTSMMSVTRAAEPFLTANPASAIVNLASLAGRKGGHPGSLAYATAKGAVLTFTRALATELGPKGVRVNAVTPGLILGTSFHSTHTSKESADQTIAGIPIARAGNPDDVARAVLFLASELDGFITGATLDINGGVYSS